MWRAQPVVTQKYTRIEKAVPLAHRDSTPLGMAQKDLVESLPQNLERLRARRLHRGLEVRILLGHAAGRTKARAPLLHESGGGDCLVGTEGLEDLVTPWELRLTDVEAWKPLAFQQQDTLSAPRQRSCRAGTARPPAHDSYVEIPPVAHHVLNVPNEFWRKSILG